MALLYKGASPFEWSFDISLLPIHSIAEVRGIPGIVYVAKKRSGIINIIIINIALRLGCNLKFGVAIFIPRVLK